MPYCPTVVRDRVRSSWSRRSGPPSRRPRRGPAVEARRKAVAGRLDPEAIEGLVAGADGRGGRCRAGEPGLERCPRVVVVGPDAVRIQGSRGDLTRLLRNLGDNAATHARTTITLGLSLQDQQALLWVADDGPGVPIADRERILQRFARLDTARARTASGGGAGLGLAICRQIVLRHHGTITVAGSSGGARFTVQLPLVTAANDQPAPD